MGELTSQSVCTRKCAATATTTRDILVDTLPNLLVCDHKTSTCSCATPNLVFLNSVLLNQIFVLIRTEHSHQNRTQHCSEPDRRQQNIRWPECEDATWPLFSQPKISKFEIANWPHTRCLRTNSLTVDTRKSQDERRHPQTMQGQQTS